MNGSRPDSEIVVGKIDLSFRLLDDMDRFLGERSRRGARSFGAPGCPFRLPGPARNAILTSSCRSASISECR
jgi:hypothetical protein